MIVRASRRAVFARFVIALGLLAAGAAGAQPAADAALDASAPNVFWTHRWISGIGLNNGREFLETADWRRTQSRKEDGASVVRLRYNMAGRWASTALATSSGLEQWITFASVWAGDALRVRVPGAAPGQRSTLRVSGTLAFEGPSYSYRTAQVCAGIVDGTACNSDFYDVNALLELPLPQNVAEVRRLSDLEVEVDIEGPQAVVPLRFFQSHNITAFDPLMSQRLDLAVTLTLPPGATCASRSGQAFNGMCPLPGR